VGANTPMKIYSYLDSGRPILATDLPMHTQVLDREVAVLAPPHAPPFAAAMARLMRDAALRARLGAAARRLARARYRYPAFRQAVDALYGTVVPAALNGFRG
jgi:glycosyltransferase involved in cell wall biosynthesis